MDRNKALRIVSDLRAQMESVGAAASATAETIEIPTRGGYRPALVFRPRQTLGLRPVYFDFHPGGFVSGSPQMDSEFNRRVCDELGIVVVCPSYRLAPEAMYPADKEDAVDAIRYILDNAGVYDIDPDRIAIGGHSAGGNIAASLALSLKDNPDIDFSCVMLDYPALDLDTDPHAKPQPDGCINPRLAAMFDSLYRDPRFGRDVCLSPVFASEEELRGLPPHVIVTAEGDSLRREAEDYASHLLAAGVEVLGRRFLGVRHGFTIGENDHCRGIAETTQQAVDFMIRGLGMYLGVLSC